MADRFSLICFRTDETCFDREAAVIRKLVPGRPTVFEVCILTGLIGPRHLYADTALTIV